MHHVFFVVKAFVVTVSQAEVYSMQTVPLSTVLHVHVEEWLLHADHVGGAVNVT